MRKSMRRIWLVALALFLLLPAAASANASQDSAAFVIFLEEDGSARIEETWRVRFEDQEYSRYWRSYRRDAWYSLGDWEVSLDGEALTLLEAPSEERPEGCFAVVEDGSDVRVEIYHRSENVAREIRIAYTVENAVILHDDVAEFRWDLTSASEISYTGVVSARLFLPSVVTEEEWFAWAHGPLNGTIEKNGGAGAVLRAEDVPDYTVVDMRLAMPRALFTGGYVEEGAALEGILEEEAELARQANQERGLLRFQDSPQGFALLLLGVLGAVASLVGWPLYRKKRLESKLARHKAVAPIFQAEPPSDLAGALVNRLIHFYGGGKGDRGRQFTATLMALSLKGFVAMRAEGDDDIALALKGMSGQALPHEKALYRMLEEAADGAGEISLNALRKRIAEEPQWSVERRETFEQAVDADFDALGLTEKLRLQGGMRFLWQLLIALALVAALGIPYGLWVLGSVAAGVLLAAVWAAGILLGNALRTRTVLTQEGENALARWQAFQSHLKTVPGQLAPNGQDAAKWKRMLAYAVALGEEQELFHAFEIWFPAGSVGYDEWFAPNMLWFSARWYGDLNRVQEDAYNASVAADGAGGGGGFSAGGGSGAGSTGSGAD